MADKLEQLASNTLGKSQVTPDQLRQEVDGLGARWSVDGPDLKLELKGAPMAKYGAVAAHASVLADEMDHHPTIVLEYGGLTLKIHTHDKGGITLLDLVYAARLERWLRAAGW
jgi:4a-hydroxytetrahydrobiopterin dehydratase